MLRRGLIGLAITALWPCTLPAQYFGQNRVRWERFDVRVLKTDHFEIHFDRAAEPTVRETARKAERWYARLSVLLGHEFRERKPIILYTNHPDFQQTTLANAPLSEGTRGFAESNRDRLVMPLTGVGAENDHVLGHEIAHQFQFDIARPIEDARMAQLPLWFIEGMAEYVTLGSDDPNTAMWLRAALVSGQLPTLTQLTTDPRLFPYRYGHAFWAYVGGRWGDGAVGALYREALRRGIGVGIATVLGIAVEDFEEAWHASMVESYASVLAGREPPTALGTVLGGDGAVARLALNPQISPDGTRLVYLGQDMVGRLDLRLVALPSGRLLRSLASAITDEHTEAIAFLYASGGWSPDSRQYAHVVTRRGDSELVLIDVVSGRLTRRIRVPGVQAISAVTFSPDGRRLVVAGSRNGQGDLFLYDFETRQVQQLTNDAYSELQPAWSPDGRWIAIATDRHEGTNLEQLEYGRLRLALVDPVGGRVRALPDLGGGARMINPQWSADSRSVLFVGDLDGVSDVFRLDLARRTIDQLTRVTTGVSGITPRSPALSVGGDGSVAVVTTFDRGGYQLVLLDPERLRSSQLLRADEQAVIEAASDGATRTGGLLPPLVVDATPVVDEMLADGVTGLPGPTAGAATTSRYRSRLALEGIGVPAAGIAAGTSGAAVGGGLSALWSDLLARRRVGIGVQAQGRLQDVGGQAFFTNAVSRWNLFGSVTHAPISTNIGQSTPVTVRDGGQSVPALLVERGLARTVQQDAVLGAQFPFSRTRRVEFGVTGTRITQTVNLQRTLIANSGRVLAEASRRGSAGDAFQYGQWNVALVGDDAVFGATSPIAGYRYRLEAAQTVGTVAFRTLTLDARWYRPTLGGSLAVRGLHVGRYGRDADRNALAPLFLGQPSLVRGYSAASFGLTECGLGTATTGCPAFDQLLGSRIGVASFEWRLSARRLGLGGVLPMEFAPFLDAGIAWRAGDALAWRPAAAGVAALSPRRPVLSSGAALRINAGSLIVEVFYARPWQRTQGGGFGFSLAPGW